MAMSPRNKVKYALDWVRHRNDSLKETTTAPVVFSNSITIKRKCSGCKVEKHRTSGKWILTRWYCNDCAKIIRAQ